MPKDQGFYTNYTRHWHLRARMPSAEEVKHYEDEGIFFNQPFFYINAYFTNSEGDIFVTRFCVVIAPQHPLPPQFQPMAHEDAGAMPIYMSVDNPSKLEALYDIDSDSIVYGFQDVEKLDRVPRIGDGKRVTVRTSKSINPQAMNLVSEVMREGDMATLYGKLLLNEPLDHIKVGKEEELNFGRRPKRPESLQPWTAADRAKARRGELPGEAETDRTPMEVQPPAPMIDRSILEQHAPPKPKQPSPRQYIMARPGEYEVYVKENDVQPVRVFVEFPSDKGEPASVGGFMLGYNQATGELSVAYRREYTPNAEPLSDNMQKTGEALLNDHFLVCVKAWNQANPQHAVPLESVEAKLNDHQRNLHTDRERFRRHHGREKKPAPQKLDPEAAAAHIVKKGKRKPKARGDDNSKDSGQGKG